MKNMLIYSLVLLVVISLSFSLDSKRASAKVIGAWLFDEEEGKLAHDSSGNEIHGEIVGSPKWVNGKFGTTALKFAANKYVDFPDKPDILKLEKDFSCMAWVRPHEWLGGWNSAFSMQSGSSNGEIYGIYFGTSGGEILLWTKIVGQGGQDVSSGAGALVLDEWAHAAITYDGNKVIVYKNGEQVGEKVISGELDNGDGQGRFVINGNYNSLDGGLGEWCSATIDEILIFDEALPASEIKNYTESGFKAESPVKVFGKLSTIWGEFKLSR